MGQQNLKQKQIAILMSTYNGSLYLSQQIDSLYAQTAIDQMDIYVRDDGSSDETIKLLKSYQTSCDNLFVIEGENCGTVRSFFELMKEVNGYPFYAFCDQDDIWKPEKIASALKHIQDENQDVPLLYGCYSTLVDKDLNELGTTQKSVRGPAFENAIVQNYFPGHNEVMNQALKDRMIEATQYQWIVVHDYWAYLIASAFGKAIFENESHAYYRQHGTNVIGYESGWNAWIKARYIRYKNKAAKNISIQNKYFKQLYFNQLAPSQQKELSGYLDSLDHFSTRLAYLFRTKVYRQRKIETWMFRLLYLFNGYKID